MGAASAEQAKRLQGELDARASTIQAKEDIIAELKETIAAKEALLGEKCAALQALDTEHQATQGWSSGREMDTHREGALARACVSVCVCVRACVCVCVRACVCLWVLVGDMHAHTTMLCWFSGAQTS